VIEITPDARRKKVDYRVRGPPWRSSARLDRVEALLATLASLGQAREVEAGRFAA